MKSPVQEEWIPPDARNQMNATQLVGTQQEHYVKLSALENVAKMNYFVLVNSTKLVVKKQIFVWPEESNHVDQMWELNAMVIAL